MFGKRADGRVVKTGVDPITRMVPYIMTTRVDAQNSCTQYFECEPIQSYVRKKRSEGITVSQMSVILAAYVRAVSQIPALNRFVVGKKIYARNELCVSFVILKSKSSENFRETTVKVYFDPHDTVLDVARKVEKVIAENQSLEDSSKTDNLINTITKIPGLVSFAVGALKIADRLGILPKSVLDASPFHTSMFITNLASINLGSLYHHLYNFGTTTVFFGLGRNEARVKIRKDEVTAVRVYPVGVVTDERVAAGAVYGMAFQIIAKCLANPEIMEDPPEKVVFDDGIPYAGREN